MKYLNPWPPYWNSNFDFDLACHFASICQIS